MPCTTPAFYLETHTSPPASTRAACRLRSNSCSASGSRWPRSPNEYTLSFSGKDNKLSLDGKDAKVSLPAEFCRGAGSVRSALLCSLGSKLANVLCAVACGMMRDKTCRLTSRSSEEDVV